MTTLPDNPALNLTDGWINGEAINTDRRFEVIDPATRESLAEVSDLGAEHAHAAIAAADVAFAGWRAVPVEERIQLILQCG